MKLQERDVLELISKTFQKPLDKINRDAILIDIVKDSMDIMEFIAILQHQHGVVLDARSFVSMKTVGEVVDAILDADKKESI